MPAIAEARPQDRFQSQHDMEAGHQLAPVGSSSSQHAQHGIASRASPWSCLSYGQPQSQVPLAQEQEHETLWMMKFLREEQEKERMAQAQAQAAQAQAQAQAQALNQALNQAVNQALNQEMTLAQLLCCEQFAQMLQAQAQPTPGPEADQLLRNVTALLQLMSTQPRGQQVQPTQSLGQQMQSTQSLGQQMLSPQSPSQLVQATQSLGQQVQSTQLLGQQVHSAQSLQSAQSGCLNMQPWFTQGHGQAQGQAYFSQEPLNHFTQARTMHAPEQDQLLQTQAFLQFQLDQISQLQQQQQLVQTASALAPAHAMQAPNHSCPHQHTTFCSPSPSPGSSGSQSPVQVPSGAMFTHNLTYDNQSTLHLSTNAQLVGRLNPMPPSPGSPGSQSPVQLPTGSMFTHRSLYDSQSALNPSLNAQRGVRMSSMSPSGSSGNQALLRFPPDSSAQHHSQGYFSVNPASTHRPNFLRGERAHSSALSTGSSVSHSSSQSSYASHDGLNQGYSISHPALHNRQRRPRRDRPSTSEMAAELSDPRRISSMSSRSRRIINRAASDEVKFNCQLDEAKMRSGEDPRTTLMIRNIPNKYSLHFIVDAFQYLFGKNFGLFDFLYFPWTPETTAISGMPS